MQALELPQLAERLAASADSSRAESTRRARRQALNLFLPCLDEEITERNVSIWALKMQAEGYTVSTIAFYLKVISAMFTEIGESTEVFSSVRHRMADAADSPSIKYDSLRRMISELSADVSSNSLGGDLTLIAILGGGLDSRTLLSLEFGESYASIEPLQNTIEKYSRPRAKRIFPLTSQRDIQLRIRGVLSRYGLHVPVDALWTGAALKAGISPEEILSVIDHSPTCFSLLCLFQPIKTEKTEILERVADYLVDNPYRWYAMQLRRGENFETIAELSGLAEQNLYYPSREIKRRVGRRMITQERAFLPGIVFFRTRPSDVAPLLRKIGSRAWVYRQTASPQAPYAVISPAEMIAFQLAVGVLIDHTTASSDMRPGDTVEIIGGHFRGLIATIQTTAPNVYRLLLPALNGIPWQIDTPPHLLRPST